MLFRFIVGLFVIVLLGGALAETSQESPLAQPEFAVGDTTPDFTLKNQSFEDVTLSELRGRRVILAFYVFAFTGG